LIDLHCHILPGLDDGARDLADAVAMARQAQDDGIEAVCATPHVRSDHVVRVEEIADRVQSLQRELDARGITVRVLPGAEVAQAEAAGLDERELRLASYGAAGAWVLLEPGPGPLGEELEELIGGLERRGVRSVVAHPERHAAEDFEERVRALAARGALIQWTAEFVAAPAAAELVTRLAGDGLVHVLGSDAHSSLAGRPVRLAAAFATLARVRTPQQMAWSIDRAPRAIVAGEQLPPPP